ncbi:MAG: catalase family peroxidase [Steroidobacteraceae bacterium]
MSTDANGRWFPLLGIAAVVAALALAFAGTAGWIGGRVTARQVIDAIEANNPQSYPGFRRAHSKGLCVAGTFDSTGDAVALSSARVFAQAKTPVLGRISIAGGDPHSPDDAARVRSIALLLRTDDGQEWRTAMNSFPFFVVATPEAFFEQVVAQRPEPATGKPDPRKMAAFVERHPEVRAFQQWAGSAPWPDSWANTQYNGIHAFRFTAADGGERFVRWVLRPRAPLVEMTPEQRKEAGPEFLSREFAQRLAQGPVRWDLVLSIAGPGDAVDDPSKPWPAERREVVAGTLSVTSATEQAMGNCRDVNFDPLVLPTGIAPSGDPVLAARSSVYSESFNRRQREIAGGVAPEATGVGGP